GDGDLDLFIGGRVSGEYPLSPRSYILRNDKGVFTDVTARVCPALQKGGMITSAVWADIDNDKQPDLVVTGEWMPVRWFRNEHGVLQERTDSMGLTSMHGMWRSLIATDIDNDGDIDLVAGNLGLNCDYRVSAEAPMDLYAADIDGNGRIDPVLFYYIKDADGVRRSYPAPSRNQLAAQAPTIKKKFLLYEDYAKAGFEDIFPGKEKKDVLHFYCDESRSCWFENMGNGRFVKHVLPMEAQFAPVNAIVCEDIDNDGYKDLLLAGNDYQTDVVTGRYDASYGCFLRGSNKKEFVAVPPDKSGFVLKGDVKDMALIRVAKGKRLVLAAVNNDSVRAFQINN
ncbi:MAG TPA: VCBS repeat-containing protein, partial [Puia sp.]|nr:VCBS repeat-containing protein [Puia sp.]